MTDLEKQLKAAEEGDADAQLQMAYDCYHSFDKERKQKAAELFIKAAQQGDRQAQFMAARCYYDGDGIEKDIAKARKLFEKSLAQGWKSAAGGIKACDEYEKWLSDIDFEHLFKSAKNGDMEAQYTLGNCYYEGDGIKRDYFKAAKWHLKAAEQGHERAQYDVGYYYQEGIGVKADIVKAAEWTKRAAEQGYAPAQATLGEYYIGGCGVEEDHKKGVMWLRKAEAQGDPMAKHLITIFWTLVVNTEREGKDG